MLHRRAVALGSCCVALAFPAVLYAQQVRTAVVPSALTVGDIFQAVIRVTGAGEDRVVFPDSLVLPPDVEKAGQRAVRQDTLNGELAWTVTYPLTAWRPGVHQLTPLSVRLVGTGGVRTADAGFAPVSIRSVLPPDTAGVQPRPPKDVLGADRLWWPWLVLAVALALIAALLWYLYRRRLPAAGPALATGPEWTARDRALQALDRLRSGGELQAGEYRPFYTELSEILRIYAASLDPALGTDLTTTEVTRALAMLGQHEAAAELRPLLHSADLVKFARGRPAAAAAMQDCESARQWVERYPPAAREQAA